MSDLQQAILDACLQLSKDALDTARAVVRMGQSANEIARGVQTMVVTGVGIVRR